MTGRLDFVVFASFLELYTSTPTLFGGPRWQGPFPVGVLFNQSESVAREAVETISRQMNRSRARRYRLQLKPVSKPGLRLVKAEIKKTPNGLRLGELIEMVTETDGTLRVNANDWLLMKHAEMVAEERARRENRLPVSTVSKVAETTHAPADSTRGKSAAGSSELDPDQLRKQRQIDMWNSRETTWRRVAEQIELETGVVNTPGSIRGETARYAEKTRQVLRVGKPGAKKRSKEGESNV